MPDIAATINHFVSRALLPVAADALAAATFKTTMRPMHLWNWRSWLSRRNN